MSCRSKLGWTVLNNEECQTIGSQWSVEDLTRLSTESYGVYNRLDLGGVWEFIHRRIKGDGTHPFITRSSSLIYCPWLSKLRISLRHFIHDYSKGKMSSPHTQYLTIKTVPVFWSVIVLILNSGLTTVVVTRVSFTIRHKVLFEKVWEGSVRRVQNM